MTIGEKIKRLRLERGLTQEELGNAVGVQKAAINKYETGIVINLKREVIQKLAKALDVNPVWLMDDEDGWPPSPSVRSLLHQAMEARKTDAADTSAHTVEAKIISDCVDRMPKEDREKALSIFRAVYAEYFHNKDEEKNA